MVPKNIIDWLWLNFHDSLSQVVIWVTDLTDCDMLVLLLLHTMETFLQVFSSSLQPWYLIHPYNYTVCPPYRNTLLRQIAERQEHKKQAQASITSKRWRKVWTILVMSIEVYATESVATDMCINTAFQKNCVQSRTSSSFKSNDLNLSSFSNFKSGSTSDKLRLRVHMAPSFFRWVETLVCAVK